MKTLLTLAFLAATQFCGAVQVLPPARGFRSAADRENFMFYQNYNHMNQQAELMKRQVQAQEEMLRIQRNQQFNRSLYGR